MRVVLIAVMLFSILMMTVLLNPVLSEGSVGAVVFEVILAGVVYACYRGISGPAKHERAAEQARAEADRAVADKALALIASGQKPVANVRSLRLQPDETAHLSAGGVLMELQTTGYEAGTNSVRVQLAKGVSVGKSGSRGKAVKGWVAVSNGEFVITDSRVVFAGELKSFDVPLAKLTNVHFLDNDGGVVLHVGSKSYNVALSPAVVPVARELLRAA